MIPAIWQVLAVKFVLPTRYTVVVEAMLMRFATPVSVLALPDSGIIPALPKLAS